MIVTAHGGITGNAALMREGSLLIEMGCQLWSWVSTSGQAQSLNMTVEILSRELDGCLGLWEGFHGRKVHARFFNRDFNADPDLLMKRVNNHILLNTDMFI